MSTILFECDATEFNIIPPKENIENCFALNDEAMIINLLDKNQKLITQTEIDKTDAMKLARLILLKYNAI